MNRIISEAKKRFELWATGKDKSAVHTNLRLAIFSINISNGGQNEYDRIKEEYLKTDSVDGKEICLVALGQTRNASLVTDYLNFVFSDKVAVQDIHSGAVSLAANTELRHLLWEYIKKNWSSIESKLSTNNMIKDRFIRLGLSKFSDREVGKDIAVFFQNKNTGGYDRALVIVSDYISTNANYKERDEKSTLEWLEKKGYA